MANDLRETAEKVIAPCRPPPHFTEEPGQIKRTFLSPAMRDCMQAVQGWMEAAGLQVVTDAAGNLRGRYPAASKAVSQLLRPEKGREEWFSLGENHEKTLGFGLHQLRNRSSASPCLMVGSHLDTVPNSGAFDGILGVVLGLALIEALDGERLPCALELVGFSEEEGVRYGLPFIGSRAVAGRMDTEALATEDRDGISIASALVSFGLDPRRIAECVLSDDVGGFVEFHIEQGVLLESEDR